MIQSRTLLCVQMMVVAGAAVSLAGDVRVAGLTCEYLANPVGIDVLQPRLSWRLESPWRGQRQTAYQVLVASDERILRDDRGDLWDSGKVVSDQSIHVVYSGRPPAARTRCFWKVRVWDKDDQPTSFSETAIWEMGLLTPQDWKAKWISARGEGVPPLHPRSEDVTPSESKAKIASPQGSAQAIILGDTMGDLRKFYSLATVIFVGRTLVPMGGSDMMEAAALGKCTIFGPHAFNFRQTVDALLEGHGAIQVADADDLRKTMEKCLSEPAYATRIAQAGQAVIKQNQGATAKTMELLRTVLKA